MCRRPRQAWRSPAAKTPQEPLARATGGAATVAVRYRGLLPRDVRAHQLGRGRIRDAERRADLHHARRDGRAAARGAASSCRPAWNASVTPLPAAPGGAPHHYVAPDYDTLVDSPIVAGNPAVHEFEVRRQPHALVNVGEARRLGRPAVGARHPSASSGPTERFWGSLPYERYVFLNMITEAGGGLEHKRLHAADDQPLAHAHAPRLPGLARAGEPRVLPRLERQAPAARWSSGPSTTRTRSTRRPVGCARVHRLLRRPAGAARRPLHRRGVPRASSSRLIRNLQTTPGRLVQSASQASYDAWIQHYRPDENSPNTTISYYTKGGVVGVPARREDPRGHRAAPKSLDDVMRLAYARYSGARGFTHGGVPPDGERGGGHGPGGRGSRRPWTRTGELDYTEALRVVRPAVQAGAGARRARAGSGATTQERRRAAAWSRRSGAARPAYDAGLNVDDEILAIDDFRVRAGHSSTAGSSSTGPASRSRCWWRDATNCCASTSRSAASRRAAGRSRSGPRPRPNSGRG